MGRPLSSLREALDGAFAPARYVLLTRENKVAQAISYYRGLVTQVWQRPTGTPALRLSVPYDQFAIERCYQDVVASDRYWEGYFEHHSIKPLRLTYEGIVSDFGGETRRVLDYLGVSTTQAISGPQTVKLADEESRVWEELFRAEGAMPQEPTMGAEHFGAPY